MSQLLRLGRGAAIAAASIAALAGGCGQIPRASKSRQHEAAERPQGKLTPAQAAEVQMAIGRTLEAQGDLDGASASYLEATRRAPKRADAALRLAVVLDKQGRFAESAPFYEAALKASPGDPDVFCDRGYSLYLQARYAESEALFRQALARRPGLARAHNNLGVLLGRTGRPTEALAEFTKAGLPASDAHLNLALALSLDLRWDEAKQQLAIARRSGPTSAAKRDSLAKLETMIAGAKRRIAPQSDPDVVRTSLPPLPPGFAGAGPR